MNVIPPYTGNPELDAFLYDLALNGSGASSSNTIEPNTGAGDPTDYQFRYIHIKYADSNTGDNMSNTPAFKTYFGVYNSESTSESNNAADYTWYEVANGFGSLRSLYYKPLGARSIKFVVENEAPDSTWKIDPGVAIDLDVIIPPSTIGTSEIADEAITELKVANAAITAAKTNIAALDQATGGLKPNTVSAAQIMNDAVTELKIADAAITESKVGTGAITTTKISDTAITTDKLAANSVVADKIAANTITGSKIAAETIGADQIAAGAITAVKLEAGSVTADKIAANAVTANKIAAGSVTAVKIDVDQLSAISADLGSINAGSLNINDKFIVDSLGNTTVQSGTTGARLEIKNNVIKVFDNNGTLRVQIGDLTA